MVRNLFGIVSVRLLMALLLPSLLWAGEAGIITEPSLRTGEFLLTVDDTQVSLRAREASLKALLEELGRRMGIEVVAHIAKEQTLTLTFDRLPVEEAIERFRQYANIVYVADAQRAPSQIRRIIAIPIQEGGRAGKPARSRREAASREDTIGQQLSRPEPFKFEFDPAPHGKKPQ